MPTLLAATGFEFGTTAGWATGSAGNKILDAIVGSPAIVTTSPRTGTYCLEVSSSAATEGVRWGTDTLGTSKTHLVAVVYVYFPTSLPSGDYDLIQFQCVGPNYVAVFRNSDSKLCVGIPGGSLTAGPVVTTNTWYRLDVHMDVSANPNTIDWRVDGTAQTQFSNAVAADTLFSMDLGPTLAAQTGTVRFDDWAASTTSADYPLGATKVVLLTPDTGGSLDVSTINTAEWNTFAGATPTLSAWNATTALAAIDEVPVGLGASADGFCRITGTDADKVGIPFTTYTLAAGESVAGLRMLACCWAASGTTCTHSFHSYNGTTETALLAAADVGTDNSSTAPAWVAKMCTLADFDTQGELDALQIRFGSTDTTPDAGVHAVYVEAAVTESAGGATVTPSAISTTTSIPAPSLSTGQTVTAAVVSTTTTLPAPTPSGGATVTAAAVSTSTTVGEPTVATGSTVIATVVSTTTTLPAPSPSGGATVTAGVVSTTTDLPAPAVTTIVTPAAIATATTVGSPTVATGSTVTASAVSTTTSVPDPTPSGGATALPSAILTTTAVPTPAISAGGNATVTPDVISVTISLAATASAGSTVTADVVSTSTTVPAATLAAGATAAALAILTTVSIPTPGISAGGLVGNVHGPLPLSPGTTSPDDLDALVGVGHGPAALAGASTVTSAALPGAVT